MGIRKTYDLDVSLPEAEALTDIVLGALMRSKEGRK